MVMMTNDPMPSMRLSKSPASISSDEEDDDRVEMETEEDDRDSTHSDPSQTSVESSSKMEGLTLGADFHIAANAAHLPYEILIQIFRQIASPKDLFSCLSVCKSWLHCSVDFLWYRPVFAADSDSLIKLLITLTRPNQTFPYSLMIKRLNLTLVSNIVTDHMLQKLIGCKNLERLTLSNCKGLSDARMAEMITNCADLIAVDLSEIANVSSKTLTSIANACHRLQGLNLSNCSNITDEPMSLIAKNCSHLRRVKLNQCSLLTDASMIDLVENCPHLLELDISGCDKVSNVAIQHLFLNCSAIRELKLQICPQITDGAFEPLQLALSPSPSRSLPDIRYEHLRLLDLTQCALLSDEALIMITTYAKRLRNLVLAKCRNITDVGVTDGICRLGRHLHYLHLGHCANLTDHAVSALVRHCPRLRYLDLACCNLLTDVSLSEIASFPKLRRIGLVKCSQLTDEGIYALVDRHIATRTLERVHLSYCVNLSISAIRELVLATPQLTHLSLTGVQSFLNREVQQFCRQAPEDFAEHQRQVFCVFSGKGVSNLREWMAMNEDIQIPESRQRLSSISSPSHLHALRARYANATGIPMDEFETLEGRDGDVQREIQAAAGLLGLRIQEQQQQHQGQFGQDGTAPSMSNTRQGLAATVGHFLGLGIQRRSQSNNAGNSPARIQPVEDEDEDEDDEMDGL